MVTSLLPSFVTATLHAGPGALGVVEGAADALTGLAKLAGGPLANDPRRRGRLAAGGYLGTTLATAAVGVTVAVWQVGVLRALAWVSRGIRSPSRDMLLTSLVDRGQYGRAFGVERAGDNAGAVLGPLLAALLVGWLGVRHTILLSIVPGLLAAAAILVAARQVRRVARDEPARRRLRLHWRELVAQGLPRALIPIGCFELGNVAASLLILRATGLLTSSGAAAQAAASLAIVMYAAHNAAAAATSVVSGQLSDRFPPRLVLGAGALLYAGSYLIFAAGPTRWPGLLAAFLLAGAGIGIAETAESTIVAHVLPEDLRGGGFGVLGLLQAGGDLGATVVAGLIWASLSAPAAFGYASAWMIAGLVASILLSTSLSIHHHRPRHRSGPKDRVSPQERKRP